MTDKPKTLKIYKQDDGALVDSKGKQISDPKLKEYVKQLVIPPAYKDVIIFYEPNPKILFEGRDAKGRRQQIYSKKWRTKADQEKFKKLILFGKMMPKIFADIDKNMKDKKSTIKKCVSFILKIISKCYFRVGNQKYEKLYSSHGISTIQRQHIYVRPNAVEIKFIGKKGVLNECSIEGELAEQIKEYISKKKPKDYIFTFIESGTEHRILATEVNTYLKEYDSEFTSKMFRTFDANTMLIDFLKNREKAQTLSPNMRKKNIVEAMKEISKCVNNTPAICKKSYINGDLITLYLEQPRKFDMLIHKNPKTSREVFVEFLESYFKM